MKKQILFILMLLSALTIEGQNPMKAKNGINTKFVEFYSLTETERDALSVESDERVVIYNSTSMTLEYWDGASWNDIMDSGSQLTNLQDVLDGGSNATLSDSLYIEYPRNLTDDSSSGSYGFENYYITSSLKLSDNKLSLYSKNETDEYQESEGTATDHQYYVQESTISPNHMGFLLELHRSTYDSLALDYTEYKDYEIGIGYSGISFYEEDDGVSQGALGYQWPLESGRLINEPSAGNLIRLDQGSGFGYVLRENEGSANYAPVGQGAIDLSYSDESTGLNGAYGNYSFAAGQRTMANTHSASLGFNNEVTGTYSFSANRDNIVSSNYSSLFGNGNTSSGNESFIGGSANTSSGANNYILGTNNNSTAVSAITLGFFNDNTATYSFNAGVFNYARSAAETTFGYYGTDYNPVSTVSFDDADRLFNIGNGTSPSTRSDVLTILKSGYTGIGFSNFETTTSTDLLQVNGDVLANGYKTVSGTSDDLLLGDGSTTSLAAIIDGSSSTLDIQDVLDEGDVYINGGATLNIGSESISSTNSSEDWGFILNAEEGIFMTNGTGSKTGMTGFSAETINVGNGTYSPSISSEDIDHGINFHLPNTDVVAPKFAVSVSDGSTTVAADVNGDLDISALDLGDPDTTIYDTNGSIPSSTVRNITVSQDAILNFYADSEVITMQDGNNGSLLASTFDNVDFDNDSGRINFSGTDALSIEGKRGLDLTISDSSGTELTPEVGQTLIVSAVNGNVASIEYGTASSGSESLDFVTVTDSTYTMLEADVLSSKTHFLNAFRADGITAVDTVQIKMPKITHDGSQIVPTFFSINGSVIEVVPDDEDLTQKRYTTKADLRSYVSLTSIVEDEWFDSSSDWTVYDYVFPSDPSDDLFDFGNAASDPDGSEANSTTGFSAVGQVTLSSSTTDTQTGTYHIIVQSDDAGGTSDRAQVVVPVEDGEDYVISIWAREAIGSDGRLQTFAGVSGWSTVQLDSTWTNYTQTVTATSTSMTMRFYPNNGSGVAGDQIYVDNISVTKVID